MSDNSMGVIISLGICVVLPIMIVWLVMRKKANETNKRTEILLAAIEKNADIDAKALTKMMTESKKPASIKGSLLGQLTGGLICSFIGIVLIVSYLTLDFGKGMLVGGAITLAVGIALDLIYFIGMKTLAKEIEAEEMRSANSAASSQAE